MSELKVYHCNEWHNEYTEFYIKSEADKVIAELEEKLNNSRNARKYWRKEYLIEYKECLHQKYNRCLAMANYCQAMLDQFLSFGTISKKENWWDKWSERWLKIAEKFKEAK